MCKKVCGKIHGGVPRMVKMSQTPNNKGEGQSRQCQSGTNRTWRTWRPNAWEFMFQRHVGMYVYGEGTQCAGR